ncbi:MAG: hypothetical protein JO184_00615 [Gammaproteobacteria bacterium]|nr:hypothetical protein [Gammaproteobacteria bacterium]MBV8403493.1 hypothetical protein [Gammaproteobacteria bacterium]
MQDEYTDESGRRTAVAGAAAGKRAAPAPSSSRMFAAYLGDIEQLLDAHRREPALREALDLPRIAVALADPQLRCAPEQVTRWCEEWVRPPGAERDAQGLDYERLIRSLIERLAQASGAEGVPMRALRRLQLRRHARALPRGFRASRSADLPEQENEAFDMSTALIEAARRWYARSAVHDPSVQANLARLAVLR